MNTNQDCDQWRWLKVNQVMLIAAALVLSSGVGPAYAQGQIPNIIGSYVGQVMVNATCPLSGITSNTVSATTTIASQQGGSFSGSSGDTDSSNTVFFTGTVDAAGNLNGTYNFSLGQISGGGNLTGHVSGGRLQMTLTGTVVSVAETCDQTFVFNGALATSAQSADLSIAGTGLSGQVASGNRITYTLIVSNAGPMDATAVVVNDPIPAGTTFSSATASHGQWQTPSPGTGGNATCSLGTLMKGESATVTITVNILAPAGFTLTDTAQVTSAVPDSNLANNTATIATPVIGGAIVKLVWTQPAPTVSNPTPAPQNLTVQLAGTSTTAQSAGLIAPQDSCTLIAVNIYKADSPPVVPIPSNLWQVVPPANFQATLAVAPAGSFYVITNLWKCGSTIIESGVSNQASVPAGPTISNLKVTGKVKGLGSGFVDGVQVFVNGIGFARQATAADSTLVIQKGPLTDGTAIADLGSAGPVLVTFKNPDGGLGSFSFKRP